MKIKNLFGTTWEKIRSRRQELGNGKPSRTPDFYGNTDPKNDNVIQLEIATSTLIKIGVVAVIFILASQLVMEIKSILILSGICFFLAMGLSPILDSIESFRPPKWLASILGLGITPLIRLVEKYRTPRWLAILLLYALFFGALAILFVQILPIIGSQLLDITKGLQEGGVEIPYMQELQNLYNNNVSITDSINQLLQGNFSEFIPQLRTAFGTTVDILKGVFQGGFNFLFAIVLLFFILLEREHIAYFFLALFPTKDRQYITEKSHVVQAKMSKWFRGQVILMIAMGLFMYAGMKIFEYTLGMKYAATIGLLAGFMELFPYIGPLLTGALALLVAANISWILVGVILGWIALSQFLEGNFLVPMVMEKVVGLSSVAVMLAISIAGTLGYALGGPALSILAMILAVPTAASIAIFVEEYANRDKKHDDK